VDDGDVEDDSVADDGSNDSVSLSSNCTFMGDEEDDSVADDGSNDSVSFSSNCTSMTITEGKKRCAYQRCSIHTRFALFVHEIKLDVVHDPGVDESRKDRL